MPDGIPMDNSFRLLVFDLDGTLVDSKDDLAASVNFALAAFGLSTLPHTVIHSYIGNGASRLIQRSLPPDGEAILPSVLSVFLDHYGKHLLDTTVPYPGVRESLDAWAGRYRMSVLTNKPIGLTRALLAGLDLDRHFDGVYGGDSFPSKKPHPEGLLRIMDICSARPADTLMIGDSINDVLAGRAADVRTCGVTYGLGSRDFERETPDFTIDRFPDLFLRIRPME
jgi:phosphoglycolate phosphatase